MWVLFFLCRCMHLRQRLKNPASQAAPDPRHAPGQRYAQSYNCVSWADLPSQAPSLYNREGTHASAIVFDPSGGKAPTGRAMAVSADYAAKGRECSCKCISGPDLLVSGREAKRRNRRGIAGPHGKTVSWRGSAACIIGGICAIMADVRPADLPQRRLPATRFGSTGLRSSGPSGKKNSVTAGYQSGPPASDLYRRQNR